MSFWLELRRRNVFKVAAAYAVAAWLIAQIVSVVNVPLDLPDWFDTAVIVLLGIGFPIALILAWAYELTPAGVKPTRTLEPAESVTHRTGATLNYVVTGLLVLAVGFMAVDSYVIGDTAPATVSSASSASTAEVEQPAAAAPSRRKIAVLPCDNLSPNPDDSYFAAGIHEEILNQLAKIRSLLVVARTSVLQYADTKPTVPQIARELDANAIVECSVRYAGDDILVTAQLIDPATDSHLWSETYPGNLSNVSTIFAMQADIAMNIANSLAAEFSPAEQARIENVPTSSPEAYALFLAALAADAGANDRRVDLLEQAVAIDPGFAPAHAALSMVLASATLNTIGSSASRSWSEVEQRARMHADTAISLDPNMAFAYAGRAILAEISWQWPEARANYERAYELNPSQPWLLWRFAWFSAFSEAFDQGATLAEKAVALQPNETGPLTNLSLVYAHAGRIDAAKDACARAVAGAPNEILCQHALGMLYMREGDFAAAETQFRLIERFLGTNRVLAFLPQLALGYARIGRADDAARLVAEVEDIASRLDIGSGGLATIYAAAGNREKVLGALEDAVGKVERHEPDAGYYDLMNIKHNVFAHPMFDEPDFRALRARLGSL